MDIGIISPKYLVPNNMVFGHTPLREKTTQCSYNCINIISSTYGLYFVANIYVFCIFRWGIGFERIYKLDSDFDYIISTNVAASRCASELASLPLGVRAHSMHLHNMRLPVFQGNRLRNKSKIWRGINDIRFLYIDICLEPLAEAI